MATEPGDASPPNTLLASWKREAEAQIEAIRQGGFDAWWNGAMNQGLPARLVLRKSEVAAVMIRAGCDAERPCPRCAYPACDCPSPPIATAAALAKGVWLASRFDIQPDRKPPK